MRIFIAGVFLLFSTLAAAQLNHVPGELLVQFVKKANPSEVLSRYETINGIASGVKLGELVSKPMRIYAVEFAEFQNETAIKRAISSDEEVSLCQYNHYVQSRETVPNDPMLNQQWHHINNDANGGTDDADIDSELAWDVTTGGVTAAGDTIVVCVIEGGNLNHPDLIENAWFNYNEIPNNGIDDDANGYIDDYRGWNVNTNSDNGVYQGGHGTNVMGMIGAKGNNELGVVGANWDVKIMSVAGENTNDELSVVAAYAYALEQRQLYDATNGERGAFVVATNASWGIDGGDPNEVPIWSAYYDTLGLYGILNCGATANNNVNIDVVGDIPTAVSSDYMISVTATNFNDIRTFSGYGAETIDLGAPGENVTTTAGSNSYTSTSGTSFASPLTAGVIGLLYSVPCDEFIQAVHTNPQFGADYIRQVLFAGVDPIENLENETVTGGRLNANNSVLLMLEQCGSGECAPAFNFTAELESDTVYTFNWVTFGPSEVVMRMRQVGAQNWSYIETSDVSALTIDTLANCANYEFEIANNCDAAPIENLDYNNQLSLETAGCCIQTENVLSEEITNTSAGISWNHAFAIESYEVYYRVLGDLTWEYAGLSASGSILIEGLLECNDYEVNVLPNCNEDILFGTIITLRTKGCGACLDQDYCESFSESSTYEYINQIEIGEYLNESGNNGGYLFVETSNLSLEVAADYNVTLSPGFEGNGQYAEYFTLWIDLNQDGLFDTSEILLQSENGSFAPVSGTLSIPSATLLGSTRLRVQMKYVGNGSGGNTGPCDTVEDGEVEEYCITIMESTLGLEDAIQRAEASLFPNPNNGRFTFKVDGLALNANQYTLRIYDLIGKEVDVIQINNEIEQIDLKLEPGMYVYVLTDHSNRVFNTGKFTIE